MRLKVPSPCRKTYYFSVAAVAAVLGRTNYRTTALNILRPFQAKVYTASDRQSYRDYTCIVPVLPYRGRAGFFIYGTVRP